MPLRVALVSHTYVVAANRGKVAALASREGMAIRLIVPRTWWERDERRQIVAEPSTGEGYDLRILPMRQLRPALYWYRPGSLRRALKEFRPDLVHVEEEPWSLAALQAALMKRSLGFRLSLFTWENLDRRLPMPARLSQQFVLRRVDRLVAGNQEAAAVVWGRGYHGPVEVLPQLGVDLAIVRPRRDTEGREKRGLRGFVVGYVGRMVAAKGVDLLLEAFTRLSPGASLLLVGEGPLLQDLQERARALGVDERVVLATGVRHAAVADYMALMDVLVLPSRTTPSWKEQFGHVLIEAMACRVPVVGSSSGEIPRVIGDAGLVFREGDSADLAVQLEAVRDRQTRQRLAEAGRRRVAICYTNEVIAAKLASIFRCVLGESS